MNPNLFNVFLTIADELSFTAAANQLNISQPRISLMVRKLEESLGFPLFHRTSRQVRLTSAGARFLPTARAAWRVMNEARDLASELAREEQSCVRLGAPFYTAAVTARMAVQKDFLATRPGGKVEVIGSLTPELVRYLRAGEVDVVITARPVENESEFESIVLARADLLIGIPPRHPLSSRDTIDLTDLSGLSILCHPRRIGAERFHAWYGPATAAGAKLIESSDMALSAMSDTALERCLPWIGHRFDGMKVQDPRLVWRSVGGCEGYVDLIAIRSREHKASVAAQLFWEVVCAHGLEDRSAPPCRIN